MAGYVPLFDSIATGTLYGRWPDIGLWPIVLALADRHGHLDVTPHYLAGVTGLPVEDVVACMKRFCEADPYSRTKDENGSRLKLMDDHRDWGWIIVNHSKYREKARKQMNDNERVASGANAERLRAKRAAVTGDDPPRPAMTRADPLSDSYADTDSDKSKNKTVIVGLETEAWERWSQYRTSIGKPIKSASTEAAQRKLASFGSSQSSVVEESIANGYQGLFAPKANNRGKVSIWE